METRVTIFAVIVIAILVIRAVLVIAIEDGKNFKDLLGINDIKYLIKKMKTAKTKKEGILDDKKRTAKDGGIRGNARKHA